MTVRVVADRDPRIDPAAGDVTRNVNGSMFYVRRIEDDGCVCYQEDGFGELLYSDLDDWRECAADDTIISLGETRMATTLTTPADAGEGVK